VSRESTTRPAGSENSSDTAPVGEAPRERSVYAISCEAFTARSAVPAAVAISTSRSACTHALVLAVLLDRSPSPSTLTPALANSGPAFCAVAVAVSRTELPDAISGMPQVTDDALSVQVPPARVADATGWLSVRYTVALRIGSARSEPTSTFTSIGAPARYSAALASIVTRPSMPERSVTGSWRLLFEVSRSVPAMTRACVVNVPATLPRACTLTCATPPTSRSPSAQVAVWPEMAQLPCELLADSMAAAEFSGSETRSSAPCAD
jgi:hypothetical protein